MVNFDKKYWNIVAFIGRIKGISGIYSFQEMTKMNILPINGFQNILRDASFQEANHSHLYHYSETLNIQIGLSISNASLENSSNYLKVLKTQYGWNCTSGSLYNPMGSLGIKLIPKPSNQLTKGSNYPRFLESDQ